MAWKSRIQKFCKSYCLINSIHFLQQLRDAEILHLDLVAWIRCMQKFCKFDFPLDSILFLQQLCDAEFLQILFFAKFHTLPTTIVWCRNSASQPNGLKKSYTEILQILFSAKFLHFLQLCDTEILHLSLVAWKRCMQKFCEFVFSARLDTFSTTVVWRRISANLIFLQLCDAKIISA